MPGAIETAPTLAELAGRWQALAQQWGEWWMRLGTHSGFGGAASGEPRADAAPFAASAGAVDSATLATLERKYQQRWQALWSAAGVALAPDTAPPLAEVVTMPAHDPRFAAREWSELPYFALLKQAYFLFSDYLIELAQLASLPPVDKRRLVFATRQYIDAIAPSNFPATNPSVLKHALATDGASFVRGLANLVADARRGRISMSDQSAFAVGRNLAMTPGSVVFRNDLIEILQYTPTTPTVHARPLVIVPPCINKYYILDLQPENSFVRWTVGEGHTVFMISWRNVPPELGRLTWDDYIVDGVLTAIDVARDAGHSDTANVLGFCVGGTLAASALAVLAARGERCVSSVTLFTTMLDFADPGDIGVYVSRELLAAREPALMRGARIHGSELAGAFASLRPNDLVWSYVVNNYLMGETPRAFDLLHWNGDSANLPGPMYVYYLRNLYIENKLRQAGALTMAGAPLDLSRVTMPAYVYASRDDHIVPWRSAYKTTRLLGGKQTFVLGASGHIAGVINPPTKNRRNYWTNPHVDASDGEWIAAARSHPGSWWPHWGHWLSAHAGRRREAPHRAGSARYPPLEAAPGRYVLETTA
jgi:poly[(R)-3-hydroxyalkanoate] polymerase subunit PhaC